MEEKTPLQEVVDILSDYYGEDKVDLQDNDIMIYFPSVTITNESDKSIDITEVYVKFRVDNSGKMIGVFKINRAEYTAAQWHCNYMHSHVNNIPKGSLTEFSSCCLGSGPIRDTMASLNITFDKDIWGLFALELDKYIHTESLAGVPYHYLESVHTGRGREASISIPGTRTTSGFGSITDTILVNRFLPYVANSRTFSFNFIGDKYSIADSPYNIVIKMSILFSEWYNGLSAREQGTIKEDLLHTGALIRCKIINRDIKVYSEGVLPSSSIKSYRSYVGTLLWVFKGKRVTLNITGLDGVNSTSPEYNSTILHPNAVMYLVHNILSVINYRYGNNRNQLGKKAVYI